MQRKPLNSRFVRIWITLSTGLLSVSSPAVSSADDIKPASRQPAAAATGDAHSSRSVHPDYWNGRYWDNQKGTSFWHNLRFERPAIANRTETPTANGSLKVRDQRRARAARSKKQGLR
jgi:hypothetical protein